MSLLQKSFLKTSVLPLLLDESDFLSQSALAGWCI